MSRITATRYLDELMRIGLMRKLTLGRDSYYLNGALPASGRLRNPTSSTGRTLPPALDHPRGLSQ